MSKKFKIILSIFTSITVGSIIYTFIKTIRHDNKMIDEEIRQWYRTNIGY